MKRLLIIATLALAASAAAQAGIIRLAAKAVKVVAVTSAKATKTVAKDTAKGSVKSVEITYKAVY